MQLAAKLETVPGLTVPDPARLRGAGTIKAAPLLQLTVPDFNRPWRRHPARLNPRNCWVRNRAFRACILRIRGHTSGTIAPPKSVALAASGTIAKRWAVGGWRGQSSRAVAIVPDASSGTIKAAPLAAAQPPAHGGFGWAADESRGRIQRLPAELPEVGEVLRSEAEPRRFGQVTPADNSMAARRERRQRAMGGKP
jgi:hypothetical protein